jgi:hypothetical protein
MRLEGQFRDPVSSGVALARAAPGREGRCDIRELGALPQVELVLQDIKGPLGRHEPEDTHFAQGEGQWWAIALDISRALPAPRASAILRAGARSQVRRAVLRIDTPDELSECAPPICGSPRGALEHQRLTSQCTAHPRRYTGGAPQG